MIKPEAYFDRLVKKAYHAVNAQGGVAVRALTALFLFLIFFRPAQAPNLPCFEEDAVRRSFSAHSALPAGLLDRLARATRFALRSGAAREISQRDLFHAHLLFSRGNKNLANPDAILLHAQEMVSWGESFRKRNVVVFGGNQPEILDCSTGIHHRAYFPAAERHKFCVVDEKDLGFSNPADVYILRAEKLPKSLMLELRHNVRKVDGRKILFVGFGLSVKNGRVALP